MKKCRRCGQCCETVAIGWSPKELENGYTNWLNDIKDAPKPEDIFLIFPMLRFIRYDKKIKGYRYRCLHLVRMKNGKAKCGLYRHRLKMCSTYGMENVKMPVYPTVPFNRNYCPKCVF